MATLLIEDPVFAAHRVPEGHVERPARVAAIAEALADPRFSALIRRAAPRAGAADVGMAHDPAYIDALMGVAPTEGFLYLDGDTPISEKSLEAAFAGAGGAMAAVDAVVAGEVRNAFSASRPPGHHATPDTPMGFCLFNNAAIAARHAQRQHGADRVAIVDFDVHHGNGTQDIVWDDATILYASTHQMPLYPGTGAAHETGAHGNVVNAPLPPGAGGPLFRSAFDARIAPAIEAFRPEFLIVSAGFDAHADDPLGGLRLLEADFAWVTERLLEIADRYAGGRLVSLLEGGYDLQALGRSVAAHVEVLNSA